MNNLRITTTNAELDMKSTQGTYSMTSQKGEQSITTTKPKMTISGEAKKVIIDSYQPRSETGLKNNIDLLSEAATLGRQAARNAVARIVADGNRMANITKHAPLAIAELAERNSKPQMHEFNFGLTPTSKPDIDVVGGQSIDWEMGTTDINYTPVKPEINYTRGNVDIYMKQYQAIDIEYIDTRG